VGTPHGRFTSSGTTALHARVTPAWFFCGQSRVRSDKPVSQSVVGPELLEEAHDLVAAQRLLAQYIDKPVPGDLLVVTDEDRRLIDPIWADVLASLVLNRVLEERRWRAFGS
jgi:hypothetical protein